MVVRRVTEITAAGSSFSRRRFLATLGAMLAGTLLFDGCGGEDSPPIPKDLDGCAGAKASSSMDELGHELTDCQSILSYNNFYEFTTSKEGVARLSQDFQTSPWSLDVGGMVNKPLRFDIDELKRRMPQEERIYRMRCVEGWSMVIPWLGFPLAALLREAEPTAKAKYVRFEALYDAERLPGQRDRAYNWPYVEGLRLDEAMHDLTLLATGIYGNPLQPQSGAPIRLVVPWKYGFKSIKSITRIDLVDEMPVSLWMAAGPREYGFYANVNPDVHHPRWPQSSERRIGKLGRMRTLFLNGYADQVADFYEGLDPKTLFQSKP